MLARSARHASSAAAATSGGATPRRPSFRSPSPRLGTESHLHEPAASQAHAERTGEAASPPHQLPPAAASRSARTLQPGYAARRLAEPRDSPGPTPETLHAPRLTMEPQGGDPSSLLTGAGQLDGANPPGGPGESAPPTRAPPPPLPPNTTPPQAEPQGSAGVTIPSKYWCTKQGPSVCVRPSGHSGKCAVKFASEEQRNAKLLRYFLPWRQEELCRANGDPTDSSDEDDEEEEGAAGAAAGSALALTAMPPEATAQDLQRQVVAQQAQLAAQQAMLNDMTTRVRQLEVHKGPSSTEQAAHALAASGAAGAVAMAMPAAAAPAGSADPRMDLLCSLLQPETSAAAAAVPAGGHPGLLGGQLGAGGTAGGAVGGRPFIADPSQVTNTTAATIPGLNAAANQLVAAHSHLNVPSALPIPITGFGPPSGGAGAPTSGGQPQGELGWMWGMAGAVGSEAVPPQAVLPEHVAALPAYGLPTQETALTLSIGLNNETTLRPAALPTGAKRHLPPAQLVQAIPNYAAYLNAGLKVCQTLAMHGYSQAGMQQFQGVMLHLAQRITHSDEVEWGMFLELDRTLRLIQHAYRLRWDHEGGHICTAQCNDFMSQIAGRHAALAVQASSASGRPPRPPKVPTQGKQFRSNQGSEQGGSTAQPPANECGQWWRGGKCSFGARCKFEHVCRTCGSTEHGTGQCAARRAAR